MVTGDFSRIDGKHSRRENDRRSDDKDESAAEVGQAKVATSHAAA